MSAADDVAGVALASTGIDEIPDAVLGAWRHIDAVVGAWLHAHGVTASHR